MAFATRSHCPDQRESKFSQDIYHEKVFIDISPSGRLRPTTLNWANQILLAAKYWKIYILYIKFSLWYVWTP